MGYAAAGEVVEIGRDVRDFRIGQAVTTAGHHGSHAELRAVSEEELAVARRARLRRGRVDPDRLGTAHHCLHALGQLRRGESVLVQGDAGGVGMASVKLAKLCGARVIATVSGKERTDRLMPLIP